MFSHVMIGSNDVARSKAFYDKVLGALGVSPGFTDPKGRVFYMAPTGVFAITAPIDGNAANVANGATIGFACKTTAEADAWHATGVAAGGVSIEEPPGWREGATGRLYLAYLRDPDGNKICALHRG